MTKASIEALDRADPQTFARLLDGIYDDSPWVAAQVYDKRPFGTLANLKLALAAIVSDASREAQLALIRAHPELAGSAMAAHALERTPEHTPTAEPAGEQGRAEFAAGTPEALAALKRLDAEYRAKFGFPFVLAVRGPRAIGLSMAEILATFERRLGNPADYEFAEALRNLHRIAELRLDERFGFEPALGNQLLDMAAQLARYTDPGYAERGELTVTYLTDAHRAAARQLADWMRDDCGFDEVTIDAVGNVVGVYHDIHHGTGHGAGRPARRLLTGSHYDTVRNAGRYDGRLGILVPMLAVRELAAAGRRLPFGIEVVGFAEEEGQRYPTGFLGSSALIGRFDPRWLDLRDADGVVMRDAMTQAGLRIDGIGALARDPARYLGFVEVHIEQGPVLNELGLPLGIVTSINGGLRHQGEIIGMASHAGTTPMDRRRDAAAAVAELVLFLERRAAAHPELVGTVGMLEVPNGSVNVVPGRCRFSLDIRATTDPVRDQCARDVLAELEAICARRRLGLRIDEVMRVPAAPSADDWRQRWERAVGALGLPVFRMPSGAGHDAMKLHELMPQAMLFVRGLNAGISHNPLEAVTNDDADLSVRAFLALLSHMSDERTAMNCDR